MNRATIHVFEPGELAREERERLLCALEAFVNLGNSLEDYLAFGKQNPDFFPIMILDNATMSLTPLAPPSVEGRRNMREALYKALSGEVEEAKRIANTEADMAHGEVKIWTKVITWEPACHKVAFFYRDVLRLAWKRPKTGPHGAEACDEFLILLGIDPPAGFADWNKAFELIRGAYPAASTADSTFSQLWADWNTGTFEYMPANDFQRAVYILFREGWRAKTCIRCARRYMANKAVQSYCSTKCSGEAKRERNLDWWNRSGKKLRKKAQKSPSRKHTKSRNKGGN